MHHDQKQKSDDEEDDYYEDKPAAEQMHRRKSHLKQFFRPRYGSQAEALASTSKGDAEKNFALNSTITAHSSVSANDPVHSVRTLQRYRAGPNTERIDYMESKSALIERDLAVSVEQVAIFLTDDNTVISFFEHSAPDVMRPIRSRLYTEDTILRRSCDGSMVVQSLIDTIVDLAMPVAAAYEDAIGTLELEVLTDPDISQPKSLYILNSELTLLRNFIQPIGGVIHSLRDHRDDPITTPGLSGHPPKSMIASSVTISPLTHTYLGDVEDHIIVLSSGLDRMRSSVENLTSLIFNMVGAFQNESMKQLTLVTIVFLVCPFVLCLKT